jgi:lysozyme family protein
MSATFLACLQFVLSPQQDGQPLHITPGDAGGATDEGITLQTYRDYNNDPALTAADLGRISAAEVQAIYALKFWNPVRGDDLPAPVAMMVMDHAVNCGPSASGRILQLALGLRGDAVDGWIGPETIAGINKVDVPTMVSRVGTGQQTYYRSCRGFAEFGRGWLARLTRRQAAAMAMLTVPAKTPSLSTDQLNARELGAVNAS